MATNDPLTENSENVHTVIILRIENSYHYFSKTTSDTFVLYRVFSQRYMWRSSSKIVIRV